MRWFGVWCYDSILTAHDIFYTWISKWIVFPFPVVSFLLRSEVGNWIFVIVRNSNGDVRMKMSCESFDAFNYSVCEWIKKRKKEKHKYEWNRFIGGYSGISEVVFTLWIIYIKFRGNEVVRVLKYQGHDTVFEWSYWLNTDSNYSVMNRFMQQE